MTAEQEPLITFGHGRLEGDDIGSLVTSAGVEVVIDVRRFPGSKTNPGAARGRIPDTLGALGVDYRWDERLGGRRSLRKSEDDASLDVWWRVKAFRAYAAWTRSAEFRAGLDQLATEVAERRTAVMCSEAVWWRCHRRIIADVVLLELEIPVHHLMHDGRLLTHEPSAGARLDPNGQLIWDRLAADQ